MKPNVSKPLQVFLSYAREDERQACHLEMNLKKIGVDAWLDVKRLVAGQDWRMEIEEQLDKCDYVILLLSKHSIEKNGYVQAEMRYILDRLEHTAPGKIFLIPTRIEKCEPQHSQLNKLHIVDLFLGWKQGLREIARLLNFTEQEIDNAEFTEYFKKLSYRDYFEVVLPIIFKWKKEEIEKLDKKIRFVIGDEYTLNFRPGNIGVSESREQEGIDLKLSLSPDCMQSIINNKFDVKKALADGEVKVHGDLTLLKIVGDFLNA